MTVVVPSKFITANEALSKTPVLVLEIEGVDDVFATAQIYTRIVYGDGTLYGETSPETGEPYVYGGLKPFSSSTGGVVRTYIDLAASSLTIQQRVEPEQGRASISQLSIGMIDKDGYMTNLIAPGQVVDEILGRQVKVYLGYTTISYPNDYRLVFRGKIQQIDYQPGRVIFQFADPNLMKRQQINYKAKTTLNGTITNSATTINVTSNSDFVKKIVGPDGTYDQNIKCYFKIEDEFIEYQSTGFEATGFGTNTFTNCLRAQRGTVAAAHNSGKTVENFVQISGNPIEMALKIMLSGWGQAWSTGNKIVNFVETGDPDLGAVAQSILVAKDAVIDLGLAVGDYVTITGDANAANNGTFQVTDFADANTFSNRVVYLNNPSMVTSLNSSAVFSIRSQYDVWPLSLGVGMAGYDVDVATHQYYITSILSGEQMQFLLTETISSAKEFIEKELYLPIGCYGITRQGAASVKITLPPIADERLKFLTADNLITPTSFRMVRGTSNRKFFNEVQFQYDFDDNGNATSTYRQIDTESLSKIGVTSVLPITTKGTKSSIVSQSTITQRATKLLNRYKNGAIQLIVNAQFGVGADTEAGDVVAVQDDGGLHLANMTTGERNLGTQLFEVIDRQLDFKGGKSTLTLLSGLSFTLQDVFATWAPSSYCNGTGSTTTQIKIIPSFGSKYGGNEYKKWVDYVGEQVKIRKSDYSVYYTRTLSAATASNVLTLNSALPVVVDGSYIVELADYSTSTDPSVNVNSKLIHCFLDKTSQVVSGTSSTVFQISLSDAGYFKVGYPLILRKSDWSSISPEVLITDVTGDIVTVDTSLGFTPDNTYWCELLSWDDGKGPYRFV